VTGSPFAQLLADRLGRFVFRYRDYLVPLVLLGIVLLTPPATIGSARVDAWLDVLGLLIAAAGQALRLAVIGFAYIRRGGINKRLAAPTLVCEGLYAHSRNPMYVGNMLLFVGLMLIYNSPWGYFLMLPLVLLALLAIVRAEERFLTQRFGSAYADYCRRVNRFLPDPRGLRTTLAGMQFDWRRAVRKDYGTVFAWLSAAFFLLAWEGVRRSGVTHAAPQLRGLAGWYAGVLVAYAIVRWLKKSRRLRSHPIGLSPTRPL
jgi:protein-S-isoprenylcysteine O-methyltransferase Ste14